MAYAAENKDTLPENSRVFNSNFLPTLRYVYGGSSTSAEFTYAPTLQSIEFGWSPNSESGWNFYIRLTPQSPSSKSHLYRWKIGTASSIGTIGQGSNWVYTNTPGAGSGLQELGIIIDEKPGVAIDAINAFFQANDNIVIYYVDYHYLTNSNKFDIDVCLLSLNENGELNNTIVYTFRLGFFFRNNSLNPSRIYHFGSEAVTGYENQNVIVPFVNYPIQTTTQSSYPRYGRWIPDNVFRELNPQVSYWNLYIAKNKTYNEGYNTGYTYGHQVGYEVGKTDGIEGGIASSTPIQSATSIVKSLVSALDIKLFGIFSILDMLGIVVVLGLVTFILKLVR